METEAARKIFDEFAGALAYVAVEHPDGTQGIGSAFHVGEGIFVTARHVVENVRIREVSTTETTYVDVDPNTAGHGSTVIVTGSQERPVHVVRPQRLELEFGPFFHPNPGVDVAAFKVKSFDRRLPWVPLGSHLDDWLGSNDFVMVEAVVLGYPPIPLTNEPKLVAARAEINALVDLRGVDHVHFILSAMPRGGFSGGLAIVEYGYALGVITSSLLMDDKASELGFFAVLSIEPIYTCLAEHMLLPDCQAEGWDDLWNSDEEYFGGPPNENDLASSAGMQLKASLNAFDDGNRLYLEVGCDDNPQIYADVTAKASTVLGPVLVSTSEVRPGLLRLHIDGCSDEARAKLVGARGAARNVLLRAGYRPARCRQGV